MAVFTRHLQKVAQSFFQSDPSYLPEILAVFLGGSRVYKQSVQSVLGSESKQSDYDSIVVVPSKHDIYSFLNDKQRRQLFANVVGIKKEAFVDLEVPSPSSPLWSEFDAVGFAGYDSNGIERSVRVLNLIDIFQKETTNLLCYKDRRIFDAVGPEGKRPLLVQTTYIPHQLVIQHDQWVYVTSPSEVESSFAAFGYMSDLLFTSACIYDRGNYGYNIKKVVAELYFAKSGSSPTLQSFCRHPFFHPTYMNWLSHELNDLYAPLKANTSVPNTKIGNGDFKMFLGETYSTQAVIGLENVLSSTTVVSDETVRQFNDGQIIPLQKHHSLKSASYIAKTQDGVEIFVKQMPFAKDEEYSARLVARFFSRAMKPRIAAKGELLYPLFRGTAKSHIRLSYIRSGYKDQDLERRLLHAEMVQAEDTLRAYRQSLSLARGNIDSADGLPRHSIQKSFYNRLVDDTWMCLHYGQGVKLPGVGHHISLDQLLTLRWRINGECYESLQDAFDYAQKVVTPQSTYLRACPVVFGLASGNVMLSDTFTRKGGSGEVIFTDFENSGFHPVMLDLATPLYVDTMFEALSRTMLSAGIDNETRCFLVEGEIVVDLSRRVDVLTQAILRIRNHYLINPLREEVQRLGGNMEDHVPLLAVALFLCATVSQNFSDDPTAFVENFAIGLSFLRAQSFDDIDACFQKLGFS